MALLVPSYLIGLVLRFSSLCTPNEPSFQRRCFASPSPHSFSLALSAVVNLMHPSGVDTWRVFSILGYSLVPVNILAVVAIVINLSGGLFGFLLCALTVGWSTFASVRVFDKCLSMRDQRWLVAYPIALLYSCFVMITVF